MPPFIGAAIYSVVVMGYTRRHSRPVEGNKTGATTLGAAA
jgi:hypothetical protein